MRTTLLLTFTFLLFTLPIPAYAQTDTIGQSQINPASPLYFLKSVREVIELKFAATTNTKALRQLEFATRRIREVKSLVQGSHQDLIEPTLIRYLSHLQELKGIIDLRDSNAVTLINNEISEHMQVLQTVYNQTFHPRARMSIRATINRVSEWDQKLIDTLDSLSQSSLISGIKASKLLGCNFLSKEASSAALNEVERFVFAERAKKCLIPKP